MLKNVSVIIPISLNDKNRAPLFRWVKGFYEKMLPDVELCIGAFNNKPFSKAKAVNYAAKKAKRDVLVITDADIFYDPLLLKLSIDQLNSHPWIIPFNNVLNIDKESTFNLLKTEPQWPIPISLQTHPRPHGPHLKGGVNIVPRQHFESIHGFDERFIGWGGEDDAFTASLTHLCGHYKRMEGTIYHLWHTHNNSSPETYEANTNLLKAYTNKESIKKEIEKRRKHSRRSI